MLFEKQMKELEKRREAALEMGGKDKIKKQHDKSRFTARERIDMLLDPDSFLEVGMFNHSDVPGMEEKTPADSKVAGFGKIDGPCCKKWLMMPLHTEPPQKITSMTLSTPGKPGIILLRHWIYAIIHVRKGLVNISWQTGKIINKEA